MKTKFLLLLPLLLFAGCTAPESQFRQSQDGAGRCEVSFEAGIADKTKSLFEGEDDYIGSLCVFVFRDSLLFDESYSQSGECVLNLMEGCDYHVYAFSNTPRIDSPAFESEMSSFRLPVSGFGSGLPMSCFRTLRLDDSGLEKRCVELQMERLVARYDLTVSPSLRETEYEIKSVRVCQAARDVTPFSAESVALSVSDGDCASRSDLNCLNSGGSISFYLPENCNGVLLPGNTNPWDKNPECIGDISGKCTFLEVSAHWKTQGADAEMTFRMYLGSDNCTDFNVRRNSVVKLALCLSDSLSYKTEWKANTVSLDDRRSIYFKESELVIWQCNDWVPVTELVLQPSDISYRAYVEGEGLRSKIEDGILFLKSDYYGSSRLKGKVYVSSWDGLHTANAVVRTDYIPDPYTNYSHQQAEYLCEVGYISFPGVSASDPVSVKIRDNVILEVGKSSGLSFLDEDSGIYFAYKAGSKTLRYQIRQRGNPLKISIIKDRMQADVTLADNVRTPMPVLSGETKVSESGNSQYSSSDDLYYDSFLDVRLSGYDSGILDVHSFEAWFIDGFPEEDALEYTRSKLLGNPRIDFSESGFVGSEIRTNVLTYGNALARIYFWGIGKVDGEKRVPLEFSFSNDAQRKKLTCDLKMYQAFPNQGFLGNIYNYQIAPRGLRSKASSMGIYDTAPAPSPALTEWSVKHSYNHGSGIHIPFNPAADDYSSSVSIDRGVMFFSDITSDKYPACGGMQIDVNTVNPHTGAVLEGRYSLDLILYVPVGLYFKQSKGSLFTLEYCPFCDCFNENNAGKWRSHMTRDCHIVDAGGNSYTFLSEDGSGSFKLKNIYLDNVTKIIKPETFSENDFLFDFKFVSDPDNPSYALCLDYRFYLTTKQSFSCIFGEKGYYHFVRQRDVGTASVSNPVYSGFENDILNFATGY